MSSISNPNIAPFMKAIVKLHKAWNAATFFISPSNCLHPIQTQQQIFGYICKNVEWFAMKYYWCLWFTTVHFLYKCILTYTRLYLTHGLKFFCGSSEILKTVASLINCTLNIPECHICPKIHRSIFASYFLSNYWYVTWLLMRGNSLGSDVQPVD